MNHLRFKVLYSCAIKVCQVQYLLTCEWYKNVLFFAMNYIFGAFLLSLEMHWWGKVYIWSDLIHEPRTFNFSKSDSPFRAENSPKLFSERSISWRCFSSFKTPMSSYRHPYDNHVKKKNTVFTTHRVYDENAIE